MDIVLALLLRLMRRARFVFVALYLVVSAGFLYADPKAGWTWFIVVAGALLCLLFWGLVAFWVRFFTQKQGRDGADGSGHE
jgi:hypothetical protein